ncbi:hypothetical protein Dimus_014335 [Dionaea muscipula]
MEERITEFFKVFIPGSSSDQLRIPPAFREHLGENLRQKYTISSSPPNNHAWRVYLETEGDRLFFKEGWPEFVRDQNLTFGDFLVFHYDGDSTFLVKIFGKNGCSKNTRFEANYGSGKIADSRSFESFERIAPKKEAAAAMVQPIVGKRKRGRHSLGQNKQLNKDESSVVPFVEKRRRGRPKKKKEDDGQGNMEATSQRKSNPLGSKKGAKDGGLGAQVVQKRRRKELAVVAQQIKRKASRPKKNVSAGWRNQQKSGGGSQVALQQPSSIIRRSQVEENDRLEARFAEIKRKRGRLGKRTEQDKPSLEGLAHEEEGQVAAPVQQKNAWMKIVGKGIAPSSIAAAAAVEVASRHVSKYPSFRLVMTKSSQYCSYVPGTFVRMYIKGSSRDIHLQVSNRSWPVRMNLYENYVAKLSAGWTAFARANHLRAGDVCLFELIKLRSATFNVFIYRC